MNAYDEYGNPRPGNQGRFGYTGQAWLPDVGLWYYKNRMYAPQLGRFMQTDPIGYGDGLNWYNYVGSDPINSVDPIGLTWDPSNSHNVRKVETDERGFGGGGSSDIVVTGSRLAPSPVQNLGPYNTNAYANLIGTGESNNSQGSTTPQMQQPQMCPIAYTPNGDTKGENPQAQGDRYNTDLPGGYEAALATFNGLTSLDAIQNGGNGGSHLEFDPRRPTTVFRSNSGNIGLRYAFQNGSLVFRVDVNPNTFSLTKAETIHFNGTGRGNMCPTR